MLQRSTHHGPVDVPAIPATIQPGDIVDWPDPIAGFTPVEPEPESRAATPRRKTTPPAPADEEPQP